MCIRQVGTIIKRRGFQTKLNGGNILKGGREKKKNVKEKCGMTKEKEEIEFKMVK
jgi:hypothetical protein